MDKGWISLHRKFTDNWLWKEDRVFSRCEAWIDLLIHARHTKGQEVIKDQIIDVNRGQLIYSLQSYASRWNWNKSKVRRFFELLKKQHMIETESVSKTTRVTVLNYDSYQGRRNDDETMMKRTRNDDETIPTPNNNGNKENNEKNENKDSAEQVPPQPKKTIEDRANDFKRLIWEKVKDNQKYNKNKDELNKFWEYWIEHGDNDKKMKFEKQKSFSISHRLGTWWSNDFSNNCSTPQQTPKKKERSNIIKPTR